MQRSFYFAYLGLPLVVALGALSLSLRPEPLQIGTLALHVGGGALFYAAPHLLWAVTAKLSKAPSLVEHAGFIAASLALALLSVMSFVEHDPSGLPLQWLAYWPLALVLQAVAVCLALLVSRWRRKVGA